LSLLTPLSLRRLIRWGPPLSSNVTRRDFLKTSAATGASLVLSFSLPVRANSSANSSPAPGTSFAPNAFLEIEPSGQVKIWCAHSEIGQGVRTSLPMILAEELGCDWSRVTVVQGDLDARFGDQTTGGSYSVRGSYANLRKAGAAAREMLLAAAAAQWNVPLSECRAENSFVIHVPTRRKTALENLLPAASALQPPADPPLKKPSDFTLIGKPTRRTDTKAKITGTAQFGIDTRIPGMQVASIERCPVYGGTPRRFNVDLVKSMPGVRAVLEVPAVHLTHQFGEESGADSRNFTCSGVAVVAESTWAALQARKALQVEWSETGLAHESTGSLREQLAALTAKPAVVIRNDGDFDKANAASAAQIEATYEVPFLAHATMEPVNCTADVRGDSCELWAPTQIPGAAADAVAKALNIPRDRIQVHVTFIGGGFGRRLIQDYAVEAAFLSREVKAPVQVLWTREDDIHHDFYRPAACHFFRAGLDTDKNLVSWLHRAASPSIGQFYSGTGISANAAAEVNGPDFPAFAVPNFRLEFAVAQSGMPLGYWRSVENSGNQFAISSFFDEAAHAAGRDPVEFLLAVLGPARRIDLGRDRGTIDIGRRRRVIELAAEKANWGKPLPNGIARGFAAYFGYGSYVAQVAEVSSDVSTGAIRIHRVVCAIDCGTAVNPLGVQAQMEGAINFGLAQGLKSEITVSNGRVEQSNFHDYEVLSMSDAPPVIEVHIVPSAEPPGGCGEPGVPPIAAALGNAIFSATGKRLRKLPIRAADLQRC
jgi:isoquinoline 1-oxidoreductase beta subunit